MIPDWSTMPQATVYNIMGGSWSVVSRRFLFKDNSNGQLQTCCCSSQRHHCPEFNWHYWQSSVGECCDGLLSGGWQPDSLLTLKVNQMTKQSLTWVETTLSFLMISDDSGEEEAKINCIVVSGPSFELSGMPSSSRAWGDEQNSEVRLQIRRESKKELRRLLYCIKQLSLR